MVMETPGPQEVGREFVRQYYTMLHEAPLHLHRFYSNNSAFVHGGVEKAGNEQPPVIGQEAIHEKIVSLNFNDCHAKIRQVDSQSTVGDSVVVQVTGELSNNGEPMRRFMQTFVLVPQMPKKFYVHNDIFRYQDEVFHEDDGEPDDGDRFITDPRVDEVLDNDSNMEPASTTMPQEVTPIIYEQVPLSNGTPHEVESESSEPQHSVSTSPQAKLEDDVTSVPEKEQSVTDEPVTESEGYESSSDPKTPASVEPSKPVYSEPQEARPFSWAALASKNTPAGMNIPPAASTYPAPSTHASKPPRTSEPLRSEGAPAQAPQPQRAPRQSREQFTDNERSMGNRRDADGDGDGVNGRRSNSAGGMKYADNQQLFVGNLPLEITEKDLRKFFDSYGKVEDLRINTKSGGGRVPNFGFVVFEKPETVQEILRIKSTQPIKYNNEHRLNVEEKKPRGSDGIRGGGRGLSRGGMSGPGAGGNRSNNQYGNGRGGMKGGGFGRQDARGSPNLGGPRGGGMSQGRR